MKTDIKWTKYLGFSMLFFAAFMLEYLSIFLIEVMVLKFDIQNYTSGQQSVHHLIMVILWIIYIIGLLRYSYKHFQFPTNSSGNAIGGRDWIGVLVCLAGCKIMTFIDWQTLKVIGEFHGKSISLFATQYLYYFFEIGLVLLIIIYGQQAIETLLEKESGIPFGGIILAFSWGAFHFFSRGVGVEIWNGISCMIFSVLNGYMYLKVKKNNSYSYLLIAIGYLL